MKRNFISRILVPFATVLKHVAYQPVTHKYPYERLEGFERTRGRIVLRMDECIGCGACGYICPDEAIMMKPVEGKKLTYPAIDFLKCSFCGLCVEICPRDALYMQNVVELSSSEYKDLTYYPTRMTQPEDIKKLLPELKYLLKPVATKDGMKYIKRRLE